MAEKRRDHKGRVLRTGESQRKDLTYQYRYSDRQGRHYIYARTLDELRKREKSITSELTKNANYHMANITLYQLAQRYLSLKRNMAPATMKNYGTAMNHLKQDPFGTTAIKDIKKSDALAWVLDMSDNGKSFNVINNILGVVRPAFNMAIDDEIVHRNPFSFSLSKTLTHVKKERGFLTKEQQKAFLDYILDNKVYSKHYDIFVILLGTGVRVSELCGLTEDDIDFENRRIKIDHQLYYDSKGGYSVTGTKTESGARYIPMGEQVYQSMKRVVQLKQALKREVSIDGYSGFLFTTRNNTPKNAFLIEGYSRNIVRSYNAIHPEQPLPTITPHMLRHTFCTDMSNGGMSIKSLQYLMGHRDSRVTMDVYAHGSFEQASEEMIAIRAK